MRLILAGVLFFHEKRRVEFLFFKVTKNKKQRAIRMSVKKACVGGGWGGVGGWASVGGTFK